MAIPPDIADKLDSKPTWAVQHEDIIRVMDEHSKEKPWSRYMIQQHLDGDPAKKTVQSRLDELVELDVIVKYEYTNQTLYDLAYDPIVTDGGDLARTNLKDLYLLRDPPALENLSMGALYISLTFLLVGIIELHLIGTPGESLVTPSTESLLIGSGIAVFSFGFGIALLVAGLNQYNSRIKPRLFNQQ